MRIVKKQAVPGINPEQAFMSQRASESGSARLRGEVVKLLRTGKAHTTTVAKVFALILADSADRISVEDVERVLPSFSAEE